MDLTRLPTELVREIVDRVPFEDWLASLTRVCKGWKILCQTSRSTIKSFVIDRNVIVKWNLVLNIVSTYQVTGIYVSNVILSADVPWLEIVTASKQLKWLTVSQTFMEDLVMLKEPLDIERLSIVRDQYNWLFDIQRLDSAKLLAKFPKVRILSVPVLFSQQGHKWTQNAPANTEILYTSYECNFDDGPYYTTLDNLVNDLPRLKKVVLCLVNDFKNTDIKDLMQIYTTWETHMEKKGVQLVVRDPFNLVKHLHLFKEAYYKNGLPYEYYTTNNQTLFSYACHQEALDTMKFLIDSGITTFEKELSGAAHNMIHEGYERIHTHYNLYDRYPFFIVPLNFVVDLEQSQDKRDILDYLISLGLNCQTTGKRGEILFREFGVAHPAVSYIILRSPPKLAAKTIREIMNEKPEHYQVYWTHIYQKLSKEAQDQLKAELEHFFFDNVLYFIIESHDLELIKKFVEEFNIDFSHYESILEEMYATMENFEEIRDYVNSRKDLIK